MTSNALQTTHIQRNSSIEMQTALKPEKFWTETKIKKAVLQAFAALAIVTAAAIVGASVGGGISAPLAFLAIPLVFIAGGLIYWASCLKDYENSQELAKMQAKAKSMMFKELYNTHGMKNLRRYILPIPEIQQKFHQQIQSMNFETVIWTFDLNQLGDIATPEHIALLMELETEGQTARRQFNADKQEAHFRHPNRAEAVQSRIEEVRFQTNLTAMEIKGGSFRERLDTYNKASALTAIPALVGHIIAEGACREEQHAYDNEVATARGRLNATLRNLDDRYTQYKLQL